MGIVWKIIGVAGKWFYRISDFVTSPETVVTILRFILSLFLAIPHKYSCVHGHYSLVMSHVCDLNRNINQRNKGYMFFLVEFIFISYNLLNKLYRFHSPSFPHPPFSPSSDFIFFCPAIHPRLNAALTLSCKKKNTTDRLVTHPPIQREPPQLLD